jgi:hypothetical protein
VARWRQRSPCPRVIVAFLKKEGGGAYLRLGSRDGMIGACSCSARPRAGSPVADSDERRRLIYQYFCNVKSSQTKSLGGGRYVYGVVDQRTRGRERCGSVRKWMGHIDPLLSSRRVYRTSSYCSMPDVQCIPRHAIEFYS